MTLMRLWRRPSSTNQPITGSQSGLARRDTGCGCDSAYGIAGVGRGGAAILMGGLSGVTNPNTENLRVAVPSDCPAIVACVREAYAPWVERVGREPAPMQADYA